MPTETQSPGSLERMVRALTPMQTKLVATLNKIALNGSMSTTELAWRNKTSRLAVWSAMRSLEAQGRAGYFRSGDDQWAASMWFVRDELKRPNAVGSWIASAAIDWPGSPPSNLRPGLSGESS
jgi:hypothetical protein